MKKLLTLSSLILAASLGLNSNANAGTTMWEWDLVPGHTYTSGYHHYSETNAGHSITNCHVNTDNCANSGFTVTDSQGGQSVTAGLTAWSDTLNSTNYSDPTIESGDMYFYRSSSTLYGWGVVNKDETGSSPEHAIDNYPYRDRYGNVNHNYTDYDMVLVSFDTAVELTSVGFGWTGNDADFSVLAYMGNSTPMLDGSTWANVAGSSNWSHIGNYNAYGAGYYSVNSGNKKSKYWLIGAYNTAFATPGDYCNCIDVGNDAFKLVGLKGKSHMDTTPPDPVPAPAGVILMAMGVAFVGMRKRFA